MSLQLRTVLQVLENISNKELETISNKAISITTRRKKLWDIQLKERFTELNTNDSFIFINYDFNESVMIYEYRDLVDEFGNHGRAITTHQYQGLKFAINKNNDLLFYYSGSLDRVTLEDIDELVEYSYILPYNRMHTNTVAKYIKRYMHYKDYHIHLDISKMKKVVSIIKSVYNDLNFLTGISKELFSLL